MEFVSCGYEIPNFSWKVIQNSMVPVTNRIAHDCSCFFLANRLFSVKSLWFENCLLHRKTPTKRHNIFWIIPWERRTQSFLPEKNDGNRKTIGKP